MGENMQKAVYKNKIRAALSNEPEIDKIVLFGSFIHAENPNDIDIAVFQNSSQGYLQLSLKYRKLVREISKVMPVDIFPIRSESKGAFLEEISNGEIIYER